MDHNRTKTYSIRNKIGFHYFPDSLHYREDDLNLWLPRLKQLNANWLVLKSSTNRAIPEEFIRALSREKIKAIIDFDLSLSKEINWKDLETLLSAYGKWGVAYAVLNQRPNSQAARGEQFWKKQDLVQSHAREFIQFGKLALDCGIKPVFSPLVPAGEYWDLAYLESALKVLKESDSSLLLNNMVLSAFAWDHGKPLNWGAGGSKVWKDVKPYKVPKGSQDQRGFRTFEWYTESCKKVLGKSLPIMLFQAGVNSDPLLTSSKNTNSNDINRQLLYRLLKGENVYDPNNGSKLINAISPQVLACNFYLLSASDPHDQSFGWFSSSGTPLKSARPILRKYHQPEKKNPSSKTSKGTLAARNKQIFKNERFILIAQSLKPHMQKILKEMHTYITRSKPVIGFSCEEAKKSASILVIANENDFPEKQIQLLQENGSQVRVLKPENLHSLIQKTSQRGSSL